MKELTLYPRLRPVLALADMAALGLAIWLAHLMRFYSTGFSAKWSALISHPAFLVTAAASGWILATAAGLYEPEVLRRPMEVPIRLLVVVVLWSVILVLASFAVWPKWSYGRGLLVLTAGLWLVTLVLNRLAAGVWLRRRRRIPALVVGDPAAAAQLCAELGPYRTAPWKAINVSHLPPDEIPTQVEALEAGLLVVAGTGVAGAAHFHLLGIPVVSALDIWAWLEERLPLDALPRELSVHPGFGTVHGVLVNRVAGVIDFVLAAILAVITAPLIALGALMVWLSDGWPVIYSQDRAGLFGRRFRIFKLRTMVRDAEPDGPQFTSGDDPRILAVGHLLRRLRIDELPQLWNILRGDMALVGPRPERPEYVTALAEDIPCYTWRLVVRPGATGWAQVNLAYARTLEEHRRKLEFDLYFIRERSLRLYALILLRTLSAVLVGSRHPVETRRGDEDATTSHPVQADG